jgi:hypothetical protein
MRGALIALISGAPFKAFCRVASAQQLSKSGTFTVQSGWKSVGETTQAAGGRTYGFGGFRGVVFNDDGSGPLHSGPVVCPSTFEILDRVLTAQGKCS